MNKKRFFVFMAVIMMLSCLFTAPALASDQTADATADATGGPGGPGGPGEPTIVISGYSGVYDGNGHGVSIEGEEDTDEIKYNTTGSWSTTAPEYTNVGIYDVHVQVWRGKKLIANEVHVKSYITPAKITVTAEDKTATYGEEKPPLTYKISGLVGLDNESVVGGTPALSCTYHKGDSPGNYEIEIDKCSVFSNSWNYFVCVQDGTLIVGKKALTVTADDQPVVFGDAIPPYTVKYSGFVEGEDETCLGGTLAIDCAYAPMSAVGTYPITPSGLTSDNYDIAFNPGTLTVAEKIINVKFVSNGGSAVASQTVPYAGKVVKPTDPTKTGYSFKGWYLDNDTFANDWDFDNDTVEMKDVTLYAKWAINTYTVKFVDFNGTLLGTQTVNYGGAATAPASPGRTGYTFTGWDKVFNNITSDLTVTAQYKIITYTVNFVNFDGTVLSTQTVNYGAAAVAPANPSRSGYTFTGWDKDYSKIFSDLIVTAQYKLIVKSDDEDIPKTYDNSEPFPWAWVVVAAALSGAIVVIVASQMKRRKKTGDAV